MSWVNICTLKNQFFSLWVIKLRRKINPPGSRIKLEGEDLPCWLAHSRWSPNLRRSWRRRHSTSERGEASSTRWPSWPPLVARYHLETSPEKFRKTGDLRFSAAIVEKLLTICKDEKLVWSVGPFNKTWFACQAQLRNETLRFLQVGHKWIMFRPGGIVFAIFKANKYTADRKIYKCSYCAVGFIERAWNWKISSYTCTQISNQSHRSKFKSSEKRRLLQMQVREMSPMHSKLSNLLPVSAKTHS